MLISKTGFFLTLMADATRPRRFTSDKPLRSAGSSTVIRF